MAVLLLYMYTVITDLHREQLTMRAQLAELRGAPASDAMAKEEFLASPDLPIGGAASVSAGSRATEPTRDAEDESRRLGTGIMKVGTGLFDNCFQISDSTPQTIDVDGTTNCNGHSCPDCFIATSLTADTILEIGKCSSAVLVAGRTGAATRSGIWTYTIINIDDAQTLTVHDSTTTPIYYKVEPGSHTKLYCADSTVATAEANKFYGPTTHLHTLKVVEHATVEGGNFDMTASTGTFQTGTGSITLKGDVSIDASKTLSTGTGAAVNLNGDTTVASGRSLTVGASGSATPTNLYGPLNLGASGGTGSPLTMYGSFTQNDDGGGSSTFATATGGHSLNGDIDIAANKYLHLNTGGTGTFRTGTGAISMNGDVAVASTKSVTAGGTAGAITLNGNVQIAAGRSLTVGTSGSPSPSPTSIFGPVTVGVAGSTTSPLTVHGDFSNSGTGYTVTTGTGAHTLNGDVAVAAGKNLLMGSGGAGTFQTGTGAVTLYGDVTIDGTKKLTTGTGDVKIKGTTTIHDDVNGVSVTVGTQGCTSCSLNVFGDTLIGAASHETYQRSLSLVGSFTQTDGHANNPLATFSTATGAHSINGDVTMASGTDFSQVGASDFTTGTATVLLKSDTIKCGALSDGIVTCSPTTTTTETM